MKYYFFKSIKCHTFSEPQDRSDLDDDDDDNNNNNINEDNKDNKEEDDNNNKKLLFSKVSSVIPFRNHKLDLL